MLLAMQLFPYHLAPYICRMLRVTPFRYYSELLYNVMREEKSYDQIPNFAVRSSPIFDIVHGSCILDSLHCINCQLRQGRP